MNLLDVNVWLASTWRNHASHDRVARWRAAATAPLGLCRVTQMAFLRLSTQPAVAGADALTRRGAWRTLDDLRAQPTVVWLQEPDGLEVAWRAISAADDYSHKLWTDDYLAAFAQSAGLTLVTLDRTVVGRYPSVRVEVI
jgi:hypothetical protein